MFGFCHRREVLPAYGGLALSACVCQEPLPALLNGSVGVFAVPSRRWLSVCSHWPVELQPDPGRRQRWMPWAGLDSSQARPGFSLPASPMGSETLHGQSLELRLPPASLLRSMFTQEPKQGCASSLAPAAIGAEGQGRDCGSGLRGSGLREGRKADAKGLRKTEAGPHLVRAI